MTIQIANSDETIIETIAGAHSVHRDSSKIEIFVHAELWTDKQDLLLENDGLFVGFSFDDEMIKTKTQTIRAQSDHSFIIEFEL